MKFGLKKEDKKVNDKIDVYLPVEHELIIETPMEFRPENYIRVVNVRGAPEFMALKDEKVIIGHRGNPVLGNKHPMNNKSMEERERVISEHKKDLEADIAAQGPIWNIFQQIAKDIVENKQKIALSCFCSPSKCHNDLAVPIIVDMAQNMLEQHQKNSVKLKF